MLVPFKIFKPGLMFVNFSWQHYIKLERISKGKASSLLRSPINCRCKNIITLNPGVNVSKPFKAVSYKCLQQAILLFPFKIFKTGFMFLNLTSKHWTCLERSFGDKHSSLLRSPVNYKCKKFYNIKHSVNVSKPFKAVSYKCL